MKVRLSCVVFPIVLGGVCFSLTADAAANPKPVFDSKVVTTNTPGYAVEVDVDLSGAKQLFLVVDDGGNGFACDWADWAEPRLVRADGSEQKLTDLKWKSARASWGHVRVNQNCEGGPLKIKGEPVAYGIGTHANSVIEYELPAGFDRFKARAGLDDGGTRQQGGQATSVRFQVYLEQPPANVAPASGSSGGGGSGGLPPDEALAALDVADGLEATLFASEPTLVCPTNIDIDHLGRVWVCEVVNYRHFANRDAPVREEGDRILILEDTTGDGRADKQTVFYQGRDIDSAMGICVLGNKVIVSCSPNVFVFTDENGDGKADRKEVLFTKTGQPQHDHSNHAFVFGPDGKLYWNFGNTGQRVHDKDGNLVVDLAGNEVTDRGNPYRQGMVFRCNLDGSEFEVLGHNFRNNYEVAVDSFGTLWQSDNDDDGNRGVRINYVMEFGNFGYTDELTGAGWRTQRTNMEAEVPLQHWHQNDPGVVPNLLDTGAGSPTGILVYEGRLLPKVFQGQMIHCDAGPSIVRAYPVEKDGAGYKAETVNILEGVRDRWFRPSDVCIAPDGSLFVADWYDPGVGGHRFRAWEQGRIYRVAPPGHKYAVPKFDFSTADGAIEALKSPNLSVRYLAWTSLNEMGEKAEPALQKLFHQRDDPRAAARALWLLSKIKGRGYELAARALDHPNADIRITALRAIRQMVPRMDEFVSGQFQRVLEERGPQEMLADCVRSLSQDDSPQVRRECAIALRHNESPRMPELWADLAFQHDGKDRWYLEALGIGADGRWDACLDTWLILMKVGDQWNTPAGRDIVWRSRAAKTSEYLAKIIADPAVSSAELPRYLRAFDFQRGEGKNAALVQLAFATTAGDEQRQTFIATEALKRLQGFDVNKNPQSRQALNRVLESTRGTSQFVSLIDKFNLADRYPELLALAQEKSEEQLGVEAARTLLAKEQFELIGQALAHEDEQVALRTAQVLATAADGRAVRLLLPIVRDTQRPVEVRRQAVRAAAKSRNGAEQVVRLAAENRLEESLKVAAAAALHTAPWDELRQKATELFPLPPAKDDQPLPSISELAKRKGNPVKGRIVFNTEGTCAKCHVVNGMGKEIGPDLSEIGGKLSREALVERILYPSSSISHNYENWLVVLEDGNVVNGLLRSQTPDEITLRSADGIDRTFKKAEIEEMKKLSVSLMPADLQKVMSVEELVDVVEFMTTLKRK